MRTAASLAVFAVGAFIAAVGVVWALGFAPAGPAPARRHTTGTASALTGFALMLPAVAFTRES